MTRQGSNVRCTRSRPLVPLNQLRAVCENPVVIARKLALKYMMLCMSIVKQLGENHKNG